MRPTFREDLDKILSSIEENKQNLPDQTYINAIEALGRVRMYGLPRPCPAARPGRAPGTLRTISASPSSSSGSRYIFPKNAATPIYSRLYSSF